MKPNDILNKMLDISHRPFVFFSRFSDNDQSDNALKTLQLLNEEDRVTAGRIAEYLDIKPSSVTQIIRKLEDAKTAIKVKSSEDARVTYVKITDKGKASLNEKSDVIDDINAFVFKGFSSEEIETLQDYLERIESNISCEHFEDAINQIFCDDKRWQHFDKMNKRFGNAREKMMQKHSNHLQNKRVIGGRK